MTTHFDAILTAEVSDLVGLLEVPDALLRVDLTGLPVVLGGDAVELLLDDLDLCGIRDVVLIDSHTDGEIILVGVLQSGASEIVHGATPLSHGW